jgi:4-amino-4-deoxy-L-arabinose transferase-like glycosyltransferase
VAVEMIDTGNWIVPQQQRTLYFSRPPLQNWCIGVLGLIRGQVDRIAIRLPSVLAVAGVVLLIYAYGRLFLSRTAAFVAGVAFASMGQVLELGRLGETDMLFTLFVTGSLLLWHYGRTRGWPAARAWSMAYLMVALGTLSKGPQAPVYFAATVGVYLLVTRRWRDAFSWGHLAGIGVFLIVWGAWQVPYYLAVGFDGTLAIYGRNVAKRFDDTTWVTYVTHFFRYPVEILFACLLPWSVLLLGFVRPGIRRSIGPARDHVLFLLIALIVTFPSVWFVPTARSRYFMPLYPCFALLIGLVADRCFAAPATARWRRAWPQCLGAIAIAMVAVGVAILIQSLHNGGQAPFAQPAGFAVAYACTALAAAIIVVWSLRRGTDARRVVGVVAIALFMGVSVVGVAGNSFARRSVDQPGITARLKQQIPEDAEMVSFGLVHHLFAYHYRDPIHFLPIPRKGQAPPDDFEYFCFHRRLVNGKSLPFEFETLGIFPCDRFKKSEPQDYVVIGRRLRKDSPPEDKGRPSMATRPEHPPTVTQ